MVKTLQTNIAVNDPHYARLC